MTIWPCLHVVRVMVDPEELSTESRRLFDLFLSLFPSSPWLSDPDGSHGLAMFFVVDVNVALKNEAETGVDERNFDREFPESDKSLAFHRS